MNSKMNGMTPTVFCGDPWRVFEWELGFEALPLDCSANRVDYNVILNDDEFWNGGEMLTSPDPKIQSTQNNNIFVQPFPTSELDLSFAPIKRETQMQTKTARKEYSEHVSGVAPSSDYYPTNFLSMLPFTDTPLPVGHHGVAAEYFEHPNEQRMVFLPPSRELSRQLDVKCEPLAAAGLIYSHDQGLTEESFQGVFEPRAKKLKTNATSQYKGVTKHRQTGKFEAHLWDATVIRKGKERRGRKRGKQIYLGGFSDELAAARTYDMAAICFWGDSAVTNFPFEDYASDRDFLSSIDKHSIVKILRRSGGGYRTGSKIFAGLTLGGFIDGKELS